MDLLFLREEALIFLFSREACFTKYRLLNHVCNKPLQKLLGLQFPGKREKAAFTETDLYAQEFPGTLSLLLHFAAPFHCFILDLD